MSDPNGGERLAAVLRAEGVTALFALCGGHISPILVGAKAAGIRVIDVRDEASAVFAADATARLSGIPGVAAVTAGPGVTNTVTAVKNAQLAQSPLVVLGGAAATLLKGKGALQDIDQMALMAPIVKWAAVAGSVRELAPLLERAFAVARSGVPGPVFLECPVDLLYAEELVRQWYGAGSEGKGVAGAALRFYLKRHADRLFRGADRPRLPPSAARPERTPPMDKGDLRRLAALLHKARRPVLVVGGQAVLTPREAGVLAEAVGSLGVPVYLAGLARGLLGAGHPLQRRHRRKEALREADLVILAGIPCDFRLDYGRHIGRRAKLAMINRSAADLRQNRRPDLAVHTDPGTFLIQFAVACEDADKGREERLAAWRLALAERDELREREIEAQAATPAPGGLVNPIRLCREIDRRLHAGSLLVADGGDFVATAAYTVSPRSPLHWLDPGVFGTLGVGGGFALGAKAFRPDSEVWVLYGDGSAGFSLAEFDTLARHGLPVLAVVGNDASWAQIAREQVEVLADDVGTVLARTDYHTVARGYGGEGILLASDGEIEGVLDEALATVRSGRPVLVNALLGRTDFRKGSISM